SGAIGAVLGIESASGRLIAQCEGQQAGPVISFGIIIQLPCVRASGRDQCGVDALPAFDLADDSCVGAPSARAGFQVGMTTPPSTINANNQRIRRAPTVESFGVKKAQQEDVRSRGENDIYR